MTDAPPPSRSPYLGEAVVPAAIALVLARSGVRRTATTVSFFSEVAHHPTSLWLSLDVTSFAHELVLESGSFTLAMLSREQGPLAHACGRVSGRDHDKCGELSLYESPRGFVYLAGSFSSTACRVRGTIPLGSHTLIIADMLEGDTDTRAMRVGQLLTTDL